MDFVRSNRAAFGFPKADLETFRLRQDYVDVGGVHHMSWTQSARGIPVFHNGLRASVASDGRLVNVTGPPVHASASSIGRQDRRRCGDRRRTTDGGASVAARRAPMGVARPVPDGLRHAPRMADVTWPNTQQLNLSVVDAQRGRCCTGRACRATRTEARPRGSSTRATWCRRRPTSRTRHVPGGGRHGADREQRARVDRHEGQQQARRRRGDLRRVRDGLEQAGDLDTTGTARRTAPRTARARGTAACRSAGRRTRRRTRSRSCTT